MSIIKCSNCEKEISDKAKECPQCGQPVILDTPVQEEVTPILCEECGIEIPEGMDVCPNCGNPISVKEKEKTPQNTEDTGTNPPQVARNTKKPMFIAAVALLIIVVALFVGISIHQKNKTARLSQEYEEALESATNTMLLGAVDAEDVGNLVKNVWYNAIYEEADPETDEYTRPNGYFVEDFNEALNNLFADASFNAMLSVVESKQERVTEMMKDLRNPPDEFEEAYDAIKDLYDAYNALTNLVTDPSGSLTSFSQSFHDADTEFANCYNAMELYIGN